MTRWVAAALAASTMLVACSKDTGRATTPPAPLPPEVEVAVVAVQNLNVTERYPGKVRALQQLEIVPQVSAVVTAVKFEEGAAVKRGDVLYELETDLLEAAVKKSEHQLAQAESAVKIAGMRREMSASLASRGALSKLDAEQMEVDLESARAAQAAARAALVDANVRLKRARVTAPMAATAGLALAKVGDLVGPLTGPVVRLTVDSRVEVYTQIGAEEHALHQIRLLEDPGILPDTLELELEGGAIYRHAGQLDYVSRSISDESGTITYRVSFPNPDGLLLDGQNVTILSTSQRAQAMIRVPQISVQQDQSGHYVYVLDDSNVVSRRYLELAERIDEYWVVENGLSEGDRFVVRGILNVKVGQQVTPVDHGNS